MKVIRTLAAGLGLAVLSMAQAPAAATKSALDKKTLEEYVRHLLLWPPQVTVTVADPMPADVPDMLAIKVTGSSGQASITETFLVTKDGHKILRAAVYDVAKSPFQGEMDQLKTDLQPSFGTPGAPVVIVVFSDYQCAYCREEAKVLRDNLLKEYPTQVRVYFKDFPLDQIHPWARTASIAGRCVFRAKPAAFWEYHDWIFDKQAEINPANIKTKVSEWVTAKGLDSIAVGRCIDTKATEGDVNQSIAEGRGLKVEATPTLFINGRRLSGGIPWPNLKAVIDWDLNYAKKTGQEAEKCCEVKLPSPLNP